MYTNYKNNFKKIYDNVSTWQIFPYRRVLHNTDDSWGRVLLCVSIKMYKGKQSSID